MSREIELYRWHNGTVSGAVKLVVDITTIRLEDHNVGELCEEVWGDPAHEEVLSLDTHGAAQVLKHLDLEFGDEPIDTLGRYLASTLEGRSDAVRKFRELLHDAGVKFRDSAAG